MFLNRTVEDLRKNSLYYKVLFHDQQKKMHKFGFQKPKKQS